MNVEHTAEGDSTNCIQCQLHMFGCTDLFSKDRSVEHFQSETHMKSLIGLLCLRKMDHESALADLAMNPNLIDDLVPDAETTPMNYPQLMEQLTCFAVQDSNWINSQGAASNGLHNMHITPNLVNTLLMGLIQHTDKQPNHNVDIQSLQNQHQLNEIKIDQLEHLIDPSLDNSNLSESTELGERDLNPSSSNEHRSTEFCMYSHGILQTQLEEMSVSTDGTLIWHISKIYQKIDEAISQKTPLIDSQQFQTSMYGHRVWCRAHLNGKTDHNFISLNVHLNTPICKPFSGNIRFILVDQSTNDPLEHIVKYCQVSTDVANSCFGFDKFIDKNILHGEPSRYILNDSVCFLVLIEQTNEERFANLDANIKDALVRNCQKR